MFGYGSLSKLAKKTFSLKKNTNKLNAYQDKGDVLKKHLDGAIGGQQKNEAKTAEKKGGSKGSKASKWEEKI